MSTSRADRFRSRHAVGEQVTGTVIRYEQNNLAWVRINDELLLAALDTRPVPGNRLAFRILRLRPDILLKELHPQAEATFVLGDLIQGFRILRSRFEAGLSDLYLLRDFPHHTDLDQGRAIFEEKLVRDETLVELYADIRAWVERMNGFLRSQGIGEALYAPWVCPNALGHEGLIVPAGERTESAGYVEIEYGMVWPPFGSILFTLFGRLDAMSYRVYLEHPEHGHRLEVICDAVGKNLTGKRFQRLSMQPLRKDQNEAVLNRLLSTGDMRFSEFHRRV